MNSNIVLSLKVNHERGYFAKNLFISTKLSESFRSTRLTGQKKFRSPKPQRFKKQKLPDMIYSSIFGTEADFCQERCWGQETEGRGKGSCTAFWRDKSRLWGITAVRAPPKSFSLHARSLLVPVRLWLRLQEPLTLSLSEPLYANKAPSLCTNSRECQCCGRVPKRGALLRPVRRREEGRPDDRALPVCGPCVAEPFV